VKKILMTFLAILTLVLTLTSCTFFNSDSDEAPLRTLTVIGSGTVELQPDIAQINIGVRTESNEVSQALTKNTASANALIQGLMKMGVQAQDIQTTNFNIRAEEYMRSGPAEGSNKVFVVENTVSVIVRELNTLGDVLSSAVKDGANTIYGITFDVENREAAIEEARQMAIKDARNQAEAIAEAAGVSLGPIHSISMERSSSPMPRVEYAAELPQGAGVPIAEGTLTIQITANIQYEID